MGDLSPFIHLRCHSTYSLSEGAIHLDELVELAKEQRMPAVALTDSGNLFAALEFSSTAMKAGIQPIVGVQANFAMEDAPAGEQTFNGELVLLAMNKAGYVNLIKFVSESYLKTGSDHTHPIITRAELAGKSEGIIALTGGAKGLIGKYLLNDNRVEAEKTLAALKELFPGRLYMELQRHGLPEEREVERGFIDLAYAHTIPLVATNDCLFPTAGMFEAQDALMCIASGRYMAESERPRTSPQHWFKSGEAMAKLFADIPEAVSNTYVIARRCSVMAEGSKPMLPHFPTAEGRSEAEEFAEEARAGLKERLATHGISDIKHYEDRLEYEIKIIQQMDFSGYFLIVSDFIRWAKGEGIPVGPGRGSGAGSVVAWSMQITDLDPIRYGLLFERFLNPERVSMPDFDIDFCQERREEVIEYVQRKYGTDHVAQIITFGKLQARAVVRDVGRVLQIPYGQTDKICKMIPNNPASPVTLQQAIDLDPELRRAAKDDEQVAKLLDIGLKLEGMHRHCSTHAAGVVIGHKPLAEIIPLYTDHRSPIPATQFSMKYAEMAGLVKFDFLGLKTLTQIDKAVQLIRAGDDPKFDITKIPIDDAKTFAMLAKGEATGVFQLESTGMRDTLRKMRPDTIDDLIALISLYRPGPMENIPTYIARKHGKEKPDYLHKSLEPCLKETYGVIIYQEQVMEIAKVLAGYSLGGADLLRRAMGKKIKEEMDQQRAIFVEGALKNGVDQRLAGEIFDLVAKFAGYGFNKSHAAAYAVIGYQTAWLKANYPEEFLTACLNIDIGDTDKINLFRNEAMKNGIAVLPPDVNRSAAYFTVETHEGKKAIRYGLGAIKGVGQDAMKALEVNRTAHGGSFKDISDFATSCDTGVINKRQIEGLARAGAFDLLHGNRKQIVEAAPLLVRLSQQAAEEKAAQQTNLFGDASQAKTPAIALPEVPDWSEDERMDQERVAVGFYLTAHPLDKYVHELERTGVVFIGRMNEKIAQGGKYKMAGMVTTLSIRMSNRGRFAYLGISDPTGSTEISIFDEKLLNANLPVFESGKPLLLFVEARRDEGGIRLQLSEVKPLDSYFANTTHHIHVTMEPGFLRYQDTVPQLKAFLESLDKGRGHVHLKVPTPAGLEVKLTLPGTYALGAKEIQRMVGIKGIAGAGVG